MTPEHPTLSDQEVNEIWRTVYREVRGEISAENEYHLNQLAKVLTPTINRMQLDRKGLISRIRQMLRTAT
jgi:hypothetical protein